MPQNAKEWFLLSQLIMQRLTLSIILALAVAGVAWWAAAALGWAPWLQLDPEEGRWGGIGTAFAVQTAATLLLLGLCFFLPTNARVMQLERSHREFRVSMRDVARAYKAVHAADRRGAFELQSEYDSVRDRLTYLREHPDLGHLEPELLELAAQMGHESRELAEIYSDDRVERARSFLRQRQQEAQWLQERVQTAQSVCNELRRWLEKVEVEEAAARSQLKRLEDDLAELLPAIGLRILRQPASELERPTVRPVAE